jgi:hypothetical protein
MFLVCPLVLGRDSSAFPDSPFLVGRCSRSFSDRSRATRGRRLYFFQAENIAEPLSITCIARRSHTTPR